MNRPATWSRWLAVATLSAATGCSSVPKTPALANLSGGNAATQSSQGAIASKASPGNSKTAAALAKKNGQSCESLVAMGRLHERHNELDQARQIYLRLEQQFPKEPLVAHRLAVVAAKSRQPEEADKQFRRALALSPKDADILSDYGYALYLQDRLPEAEKALRESLQLDPYNKSCKNNLGLVLGQLGKYDDSYALFQQTGTDAEARANLAFVYAQQGKLDPAGNLYNQALTLDDKLRPAAEGLVQVAQAKRGQRTALANRAAQGNNGMQQPDQKVQMAQYAPAANGAQPASTPNSAKPAPGTASDLVSLIDMPRAAPANRPTSTLSAAQGQQLHPTSTPARLASAPRPSVTAVVQPIATLPTAGTVVTASPASHAPTSPMRADFQASVRPEQAGNSILPPSSTASPISAGNNPAAGATGDASSTDSTVRLKASDTSSWSPSQPPRYSQARMEQLRRMGHDFRMARTPGDKDQAEGSLNFGTGATVGD